jgi:hypothetical protein
MPGMLCKGGGEMWAFLMKALMAVPAAATSNLAVASYAITIAAYALTMWRVSRNRNLLENLKHLPKKDRLLALEIEMGGVRLAAGIDPEQWVRSRVHRYYLISFITGCATILIIGGMAIWHSWGSVDIAVDLYKSSSLSSPTKPRAEAHQRSAIWPSFIDVAEAQGYRPPPLGSEFNFGILPMEGVTTLNYVYKEYGNRIEIEPQLGFVDRQGKGEVTKGFSWNEQPFTWDFPILSVKIVNNTKKTLLLTEATFQVDKSDIDLRPIIVVEGPSYNGNAYFKNEGWGPITNVEAKFNIGYYKNCEAQFDPSEEFSERVEDLEGGGTFPVGKYVPDYMIDKVKQCYGWIESICYGRICRGVPRHDDGMRCLDAQPREICHHVSRPPDQTFLENFLAEAEHYSAGEKSSIRYERICSQTPVCVQGQITFDDAALKSRSVSFSTIVILEEPGAGGASPPSYQYDVLLPAGEVGYTRRKAISQEIKPGEVDHFLIRLASDKSAHLHFLMNILEANGAVAWKGDFQVGILVPRSGAKLALHGLGDKAR